MNEVNKENNSEVLSIHTDIEILSSPYQAAVFVIPDLLPIGLSILAGKPKTKKSLMALDMAFAVASGGRFLNEDAETARCALSSPEDSEARIQARLRTIIGDSTGTGHLYIETKWPRLDAGCLENLEKWIVQHQRVKLIIIDTFNKIRGFKRQGSSIYEKDYAEVGKLKIFADKHLIAVVLIHHLRKSEYSGYFGYDIGIHWTCRCCRYLVLLKKDRGQEAASLFITGRDVEDKNLNLKFNSESLSWEIAANSSQMSLSEPI